MREFLRKKPKKFWILRNLFLRMSQNLIVFPGKFWAEKSKIGEFIIVNEPMLGIAEKNCGDKGKIQNNQLRNNVFRINLFP